MKKVLLLAMCLTAIACQNDSVTEDVITERKVVFKVHGDGFGSPVFSRATDIATSDMTDLWLFDFVDDECVQYVHLTADDEDWANPTMTLAMGEHCICALASRGDNPVLDEDAQTVTWSMPRDAFWADKIVTVEQSTSAVSIAVDRVVTKLRIAVTDEVPAKAASISATMAKRYYGINYWTGAPASEQVKEQTITIPTNYVGTSGQLAFAFFSVSSKAEWTTNVTVTSADASGNPISSVIISGAPFKANRATEYSGRLFGEDAGMSITLNDTWDDTYTATW